MCTEALALHVLAATHVKTNFTVAHMPQNNTDSRKRGEVVQAVHLISNIELQWTTPAAKTARLQRIVAYKQASRHVYACIVVVIQLYVYDWRCVRKAVCGQTLKLQMQDQNSFTPERWQMGVQLICACVCASICEYASFKHVWEFQKTFSNNTTFLHIVAFVATVGHCIRRVQSRMTGKDKTVITSPSHFIFSIFP